jgi:sphingomyelin phosphodiesterase 2
MNAAAERGHLVIGLGDFNMIPLSLAHRLITTHAPVKDVWREVFPDSSIGAAIDPVEKERGRPVPDIDFNITNNGTTCDSLLNTWRWSKEQRKQLESGKDVSVGVHTLDPKAKRLDYIFIGNGIQHGQQKESFEWTIERAKIGMRQRHPTLECSLSDHFSVEATITRKLGGPNTSRDISAAKEEDEAGEMFDVTIGDATLDSAPRFSAMEKLPVSIYDEILNMIHTYTHRERRQRRFRLTHFVTSVFVSIGCFIAVWWSPHNYVSFLFILVSTLGFGAGIVDGLIGGLFVGSEIRALKEFEWEIKNARQAIRGGANAEIELRDWYD